MHTETIFKSFISLFKNHVKNLDYYCEPFTVINRLSVQFFESKSDAKKICWLEFFDPAQWQFSGK